MRITVKIGNVELSDELKTSAEIRRFKIFCTAMSDSLKDIK